MKRSLTPRPRYTTRMILRPFRRRDVDGVLEAALGSLNDLNRWLPWAHPSYNRSDATAFIKDSLSAWTESRAFDFTLRYRDDLDRHLGNISVWFTSRAAMTGEIGYWVRSDETGFRGSSLTISQWVSMAVLVAVVGVWWYVLRQPARDPDPQPATE